MRRVTLLTAAAVVMISGGLACRPGPTSPSPVLSVSRVVITGSDSVAPGESMQLSAAAVLSDGTTRAVTKDVTWEASSGSPLTISASGLVTASHERGEGEITARYSTLPAAKPGAERASLTMFVLPRGTYVLAGSVKDGGAPLSGVAIELSAGSAAGMATTSNPSFRFYGVEGETEVRASKAGYETQTRRIAVLGHQTMTFDLIPSDPWPIVGGTYTLRIVAAAECRDLLPEIARDRTYTAVVTQQGFQLKVALTGSKLGLWGSNSFSGTSEHNRTLFTLDTYVGAKPGAFGDPSVLEFVTAPNTYFTFFGSAVTTATENGYAGLLDGSVELLAVLNGPWDYGGGDDYAKLASCRSTTHQFTLTRSTGTTSR